MNIVFTLDDNFARQTAAALVSIFENNELNITIYILSKGIRKDNKKILSDICESYSQKIVFYELNDLSTFFDTKIDTGGWNDIVLARLFIDDILPKDVHRILYLDGDVIVRHSLEDLWNTDLGSNVLGMVQEPTINAARKEYLGIDKDGIYYNAGILLIDLDAWRKKGAGKRIVDFYKSYDYKLFANDQDAINGELKDEIYKLDITYNYCNTYYFYPYRAIKKMVAPNDFYSREEFDAIKADPCIVHFLGEERPWREGNRHLFRTEFAKYYNMTPYGKAADRDDGIFEFGWKNYFRVWAVFNALMKPFPMLRLRIINSLIPFVLNIRKKKKA